MKYHINNEGVVGRCHATQKVCEFASADDPRHFSSKAEAERAAEKMLAQKYGGGYTISGNTELSHEVSEIVKKASKSSHPKKITEKYARDKIFSGDASKVSFLKNISEKNISTNTKEAIGKMALRADVHLSYNNINSENFRSGDSAISSQVDLIDEDVHAGSIEDYVKVSTASLPWN